MSKSKKITIISSIVASVLIVLVLGTVFDLQISKALADLPNGQYYTSNLFAIIGECFGEDVLYLLVISSCAILFFYILKNPFQKKWQNYLLQGIVLFISYIVSIYLFYVTLDNFVPYVSDISDYIHSAIGIITIFLFPIFITATTYFLISKIKLETIKQLWKWALLVIIVAFVSNSIIQIAKHIFDRTRFRAMVFSGDNEFSFFTNWFTINQHKFSSNSFYADDFFKSFPSGHTCAAASTFVLVLLPYYIQNINTKKNKIIFWSVASIYTFLVALSRIVAGAHFFTDVYIASLITVACVYVTYIVINIVCKKLESKFATASETSNNNSQPNTENISTNTETPKTNISENLDKANALNKEENKSQNKPKKVEKSDMNSKTNNSNKSNKTTNIN